MHRRPSALRRFLRDALVRSEEGIALVMALAFTAALMVMSGSVAAYVVSNQGSASHSDATVRAAVLADAGVNSAVAMLSNSANWSNPTTGPTSAGSVAHLPASKPAAPQSTLDGGSVYYWGTFDASSSSWTLYGKSVLRNPASPANTISRTSSTRVQVTAGGTVSKFDVYNVLYSNAIPPAASPGACTTNVTNGTSGVMESSPIYVRGNLCMTGNPLIGATVQVDGNASLQNSSRIGTSAAPVPRVSVAGSTTFTGTSAIYAGVVNRTTDGLRKPPVDIANWYQNADLGPKSGCSTGSISGGFDSNSVQDWGRSTFILTPQGSSYSCTKKDAQGNVIAKLIWTANGCNGTLQIQGTIFIDGPVDTTNCTIAVYSGRGTIYASSFNWHNGATLCATSGCTSAWDTEANLLVLVAGHPCASSPCGASDFLGFSLQGAAVMQAAVYCVANASIANGTQNWGPVIAEQLDYQGGARQVQINSLPAGAPVTTTTSAASLNLVSGSYAGG